MMAREGEEKNKGNLNINHRLEDFTPGQDAEHFQRLAFFVEIVYVRYIIISLFFLQ